MSSEKVKNRIIVLEPTTKSTKELLGLISEKDLAEIVTSSSADTALQEVATSLPCMMIVSIMDNADVPSRIQLFKRLESAIKVHGLKIYVVTPLKNRQLGDLITQKMGVADYIMEPVPVRTMMFKANLQLKAVDNFRRQQEMKKLADEKIVIKKADGSKKNDSPNTNEVKAGQKPALQMAEDTFLFKNSGVKKAGKKFTVELEGPDPSTGEWVQHEDKGDAKNSWRWVPNEEAEKQKSGEKPKDGWVHEGEKPVFNDATNKWAMTSETPSLALKAEGKTVAQKLGVDEKGEIFVAEDSPAAEANLKKNRVLAAQKKMKASAQADLVGAEAAAEKDPARKPLIQGKGKPEEKKPAAAEAADVPSAFNDKSAEGEIAAAPELQDKRDPNSKDPISVLNGLKKRRKRADGKDEDEELTQPEQKEEPAKKGISPLDFLKKKKEELERASTATIEADAAPKGVNPLPEAKSEELETPEIRQKKAKKKRNKGADGLEALSASLAEEEQPDEEKTAEAPAAVAEKSETATSELPSLAGLVPKAPPLRSDPAEKRGPVNDRQTEGEKTELPQIKALKAKKKRALEDIQARLKEELPENISAEDEEKIREELGLKGRPEIKAKELVRKKRLKDVKAMKDKLSALDEELSAAEETAKGDVVSANSKDPDVLRREGDLSAEKLRGIRGATDSDSALAEEDEESTSLKKKAKEQKKKGSDLLDGYFYMPEAELLPLGNAWERAGEHYAYLNSTVRYRGFDKLEDLLPLWIAATDDVPQLLDKTKQWRFSGAKPEHAKTLNEVPADVREFLLALREQLKKPEAEEPEEAAAAESETLAKETAEEAAPGKKRRKKKTDEERAGIDSLLSEVGEEEASAEKEESNGTENGESFEEAARSEASAEAEDSSERTRAKATEEARANAKDSLEAYAEQLSGGSDKKSAAMEKFLERRRKKLAEGVPSTEAAVANTETATAAAAAAGKSVYLGVMIALSDAVSPEIDTQKALERVVNSLESAFGECFAACVSVPDSDGNANIWAGSESSPKMGANVELSSGFYVPISKVDGEVLGHLFLKLNEGRAPLGTVEEKTIRQAAARLWPILMNLKAGTSAA